MRQMDAFRLCSYSLVKILTYMFFSFRRTNLQVLLILCTYLTTRWRITSYKIQFEKVELQYLELPKDSSSMASKIEDIKFWFQMYNVLFDARCQDSLKHYTSYLSQSLGEVLHCQYWTLVLLWGKKMEKRVNLRGKRNPDVWPQV